MQATEPQIKRFCPAWQHEQCGDVDDDACLLRAEAEHEEAEAFPKLEGPGCKLLLVLAEQRCLGIRIFASPVTVQPVGRGVVFCS